MEQKYKIISMQDFRIAVIYTTFTSKLKKNIFISLKVFY